MKRETKAGGWVKKLMNPVMHITKGALWVKWEMDRNRYEIYRNGVRVEFGRTPHYPLEKFLEYAEMAWAN